MKKKILNQVTRVQYVKNSIKMTISVRDQVRDQCSITGIFRGAAHWSGNINLQLTKKNFVIF